MSCVRASGRGEAAWACEAMCFSTLVAATGRCATAAAVAAPAGVCPRIKPLLCARVLRKFFDFAAIREGFKEIR